MKTAFQKYPFFLLFLPLFIILHIHNTYGHLIRYSFVATEILILFIAPLLIFTISFILLRTLTKASLFSFALLFFFYFTGDIKDSLKTTWPGSLVQSYTLLLPVIFILLITLFVLIRRNNKAGIKIMLFLNLASLLLVAIDSLSMLAARAGQSGAARNNYLQQTCNNCKKPDIYYIIFDSYSSSPLLQKEFNYSNTSIDSSLVANGFYIVSGSKSNYNLTPFSISSIFNMQYLSGADTSHVLYLKDYLAAVDKVYYSGLIPAMENSGYTIYNHSIFDFNNHPSSIPGFDIWKTTSIYQQFNILKKVHNETGWQLPAWMNITMGKDGSYIDNRDKHDSTALAHLYQTITGDTSSPRFVYTHFFLPHSPYSYDSAGNKIRLTGYLSPETDKQAYIQQVAYVNTIMKVIIQKIKDGPKKEAVIIIQGDHGYRFFDAAKKAAEFPNLNAIYFPDQDYRLLNDSLSSVNTFRILLNKYFRQDHTLLPATTFFLKYQ